MIIVNPIKQRGRPFRFKLLRGDWFASSNLITNKGFWVTCPTQDSGSSGFRIIRSLK